MIEKLLPYYQQELSALRELGHALAKSHPKLAARLGMADKSQSDPHVDRFIEASAWLNARIQHKLNDDYSEITDALLDIIYPHYQQPLPAMFIAQLQPHKNLASPIDLPKGLVLEPQNFTEGNIYFETCYPLYLLPITIKSAAITAEYHSASSLNVKNSSLACMRITLECLDKTLTFKQLAPKYLRLYLNGANELPTSLYDTLMLHTQTISIRDKQHPEHTISVPSTSLRPVGFSAEEMLLPYPTRSHHGYRLLTEFFNYAKKFLFIDLNLENISSWENLSNQIEIVFYFDEVPTPLLHNINKDHLMTNCVPAINLFEKIAEPIIHDHKQTEYQIILDSQNSENFILHHIKEITAKTKYEQELIYKPFYHPGKITDKNQSERYWYARRSPQLTSQENMSSRLVLINSELDLNDVNEEVLQIKTLCCNSAKALEQFFQHESKLTFQLRTGSAPLQQIVAISHPTRVIQSCYKIDKRWPLIGHLALNHLPLADLEQDTAETLRNLLQHYNYSDVPENMAIINNLQQIETKRQIAHIFLDNIPSVVQGFEIKVHFTSNHNLANSLVLFGYVLDQFFAVYATLNTFTQLSLTLNSNKQMIKQWPPRVGERLLL